MRPLEFSPLIHAARVLLLALLAGYFVLNKPFASLGTGKIYAGEIVLAILSVVSLLHFREVWLSPLRRFWLPRITLAFLIYGGARVLIDTIRIWNDSGPSDAFWALRDGVCVGYALFAFVAVPVLASATASAATRLASLLSWVAFPALIWTLLTICDLWPATVQYMIDNRKVDMLSLSVTVSAWVLGVVALSDYHLKASTSRRHNLVLLIAGALACSAVAMWMPIRAAWIAGAVLGVTLLLMTFPRWINRYVVGFILAAAVIIWTVALPYVQNNDSALAERIRVTIFGGDVQTLKTPEGKNALLHVEWRSKFWERCIQQTSERAPLFGLGFGSNLTELMRGTWNWWRYIESQQLNPPNRSPHNATITIYARMGLIGLSLWLALILGTFARGLRYCRSGIDHPTPEFYAGLTIFGTWLIYLSYMSVGVVLENPFGGIWFWVLTGTIHTLPNIHHRDTEAQS